MLQLMCQIHRETMQLFVVGADSMLEAVVAAHPAFRPALGMLEGAKRDQRLGFRFAAEQAGQRAVGNQDPFSVHGGPSLGFMTEKKCAATPNSLRRGAHRIDPDQLAVHSVVVFTAPAARCQAP
jgi:hypothetical protein